MSLLDTLRNRSTAVLIVSVIGGITIGLVLKHQTKQPWSEREIMYIKYPGELFVRAVSCLIVPLVVFSVASASSNLSRSGKVGLLNKSCSGHLR